MVRSPVGFWCDLNSLIFRCKCQTVRSYFVPQFTQRGSHQKEYNTVEKIMENSLGEQQLERELLFFTLSFRFRMKAVTIATVPIARRGCWLDTTAVPCWSIAPVTSSHRGFYSCGGSRHGFNRFPWHHSRSAGQLHTPSLPSRNTTDLYREDILKVAATLSLKRIVRHE